VAQAIVKSKTRIIDIDLRAYFDNVQHYLLLPELCTQPTPEHLPGARLMSLMFD
jgi:RNA-directed DNA polymerase